VANGNSCFQTYLFAINVQSQMPLKNEKNVQKPNQFDQKMTSMY